VVKFITIAQVGFAIGVGAAKKEGSNTGKGDKIIWGESWVD